MSAEELPDTSGSDPKSSSIRPSSPPPSAGLGALTGSSNLDSLEFVMDVPVEVAVEIGRKKMKIADILRISSGSVLELDKAAGEPLDIYVNHRVVARGEAVVVGDHYGVRLTEILFNEDGRVRGPEGR